MESSLQGKVIVVTGADSLIGTTVVRKVLSQGACVVSCEPGKIRLHHKEKNARVEREVIFPYNNDVSSEEFAKKCIEYTTESFGKIDYLITAPDFLSVNTNVSKETFFERLRHSLLIDFFISKYSIFELEKCKGGIISVGSDSSFKNKFNSFLFSAMRCFLKTITKDLYSDLKSKKVKINYVHMDIDSLIKEKASQSTMLERKTTRQEEIADEIATSVIRLISNLSSCFSGFIYSKNLQLS